MIFSAGCADPLFASFEPPFAQGKHAIGGYNAGASDHDTQDNVPKNVQQSHCQALCGGMLTFTSSYFPAAEWYETFLTQREGCVPRKDDLITETSSNLSNSAADEQYDVPHRKEF